VEVFWTIKQKSRMSLFSWTQELITINKKIASKAKKMARVIMRKMAHNHTIITNSNPAILNLMQRTARMKP